jgi:hypothetical protein
MNKYISLVCEASPGPFSSEVFYKVKDLYGNIHKFSCNRTHISSDNGSAFVRGIITDSQHSSRGQIEVEIPDGFSGICIIVSPGEIFDKSYVEIYKLKRHPGETIRESYLSNPLPSKSPMDCMTLSLSIILLVLTFFLSGTLFSISFMKFPDPY